MKIRTVLSFLVLTTLFFACDPDGRNNSTGDNDQPTPTTDKPAIQTPTEETTPAKTPPATAAPHHFICYNNDAKPSMSIAIGYDENDNALDVKYKGQTASMTLTFLKEEVMEGGSYPTIESYYSEIYEGKENGVYKLTHSGNWDYAEYTRKKDGKKFNFTIDFDLTIDGDGYRTTPCF